MEDLVALPSVPLAHARPQGALGHQPARQGPGLVIDVDAVDGQEDPPIIGRDLSDGTSASQNRDRRWSRYRRNARDMLVPVKHGGKSPLADEVPEFGGVLKLVGLLEKSSQYPLVERPCIPGGIIDRERMMMEIGG